MATLVNGNGNPAVYAQQDADLYVGVMGTTSCIMSVGSKFAATIETANLISVADGVILTKEGRRIQTDVGEVDEFNIPNGAAGVTRYYIIGYHLYTDGQGSQKCETFVQLMSSATDTIPEAEFRNGATEVYVSLYRVTQVGLTLNDPESLLPDALNIGDINASLTEKVSGFSDTTYSAVTGLAYDATNKKLGLKVGADTVIPFSGGLIKAYLVGMKYHQSPRAAWDCINTDGSHSSQPTYDTSHTPDQLVAASDLVSAASTNKITLAKAGYYLYSNGEGMISAITQHSVGDQLTTTDPYVFTLIYFGDTNPFS